MFQFTKPFLNRKADRSMIYTFSASNLCLREPQNKMSINALPLLFRECSQSGSELFMGNDFLIVFIRRSRSKNHMPADSISPIQRIICTITILLPFLRSFGAFPLCHFRRKLIRNLHIFIILVKGIVVPHIDLCHIFPAFSSLKMNRNRKKREQEWRPTNG